MRISKEEIKNRVNKIVDYIIENKCTIRQTEESLGINRGVINSDLQNHLNLINDINKIEQVKEILKNNRRKDFNKYKIVDDYVIIYIYKRNGQEFQSKIDIENLNKLIILNYPWNAKYDSHTNGYYAQSSEYLGVIHGKPKYKTHYLHRIVTNTEGIDCCIDHINHDTLDNRKENLKISTSKENSRNRNRANKNNKTSGERNISFDKKSNKWIVQLYIENKNTILGKFEVDKLEQAIQFAKLKRKEFYNEKTLLN